MNVSYEEKMKMLGTVFSFMDADNSKTISIDETSIYLNMTLTYGRSKSGTRVIKKINKYPFKKI